MIIDTSAIIAILFGEAEAEAFLEAIEAAERPALSAFTYLECSAMLLARRGTSGRRDLDAFIDAGEIEVIAFAAEDAVAASAALETYGKGRHRARLNLGDAVSYATAKRQSEPLLFKGDDLAATDTRAAV